jgi:pSer/pThr/pTyr-binding forkhead associated (FHA) protein
VDRIIVEFLSGSREGQVEVYPVARFASLYMGRDPHCDIRVDAERDVMVSRSHAVIEWIDEEEQPRRYTLTDLLSSNGTYVNGERLLGTADFKSGDRVRLGVSGPEFVVHIEEPRVDLQSEITQSMRAEQTPTPVPFVPPRALPDAPPANVTIRAKLASFLQKAGTKPGETISDLEKTRPDPKSDRPR